MSAFWLVATFQDYYVILEVRRSVLPTCHLVNPDFVFIYKLLGVGVPLHFDRTSGVACCDLLFVVN